MKFNNYSKLNFSDTSRQLNKINEIQIQLRNSYDKHNFKPSCSVGLWQGAAAGKRILHSGGQTPNALWQGKA
jgi:hypothetical protein